MQNAADLGCILLMWKLRMYATYNFTTCANYTKCEMLVWNMWRIGTSFSRAVKNWYQFFTVWNLRNVKFTVQHCFPSDPNIPEGPENEKNIYINTIPMYGEKLYQLHAAQRQLLQPLNNLKKKNKKKNTTDTSEIERTYNIRNQQAQF